MSGAARPEPARVPSSVCPFSSSCLFVPGPDRPPLVSPQLSSPGASSSSAAAWGCCRHSPQPLRSGGATGSRVTVRPGTAPCGCPWVCLSVGGAPHPAVLSGRRALRGVWEQRTRSLRRSHGCCRAKRFVPPPAR